MSDGWRERLRNRIAAMGLTNAEVARRAGVGPTFIRDVLDRDATPSLDKAARLAFAVGLTLQQLWEGEKLVRVHLKVDGVMGDAVNWVDIAERHARMVPVTLFSEETVSVEVSTADASGFRAGDILIGQKVRGPGLSNVTGVECIILTQDGRKVVGMLLPGATAGTHSIRPLDLRRSEIRDVTVEWAAPISMILRGQ